MVKPLTWNPRAFYLLTWVTEFMFDPIDLFQLSNVCDRKQVAVKKVCEVCFSVNFCTPCALHFRCSKEQYRSMYIDDRPTSLTFWKNSNGHNSRMHFPIYFHVWFMGGFFEVDRSNGAISSWDKSRMAAGSHFKNFKWPYLCEASSNSFYVYCRVFWITRISATCSWNKSIPFWMNRQKIMREDYTLDRPQSVKYFLCMRYDYFVSNIAHCLCTDIISHEPDDFCQAEPSQTATYFPQKQRLLQCLVLVCFIGSWALSFSGPLLSVDVEFCLFVCLFVCLCVRDFEVKYLGNQSS